MGEFYEEVKRVAGDVDPKQYIVITGLLSAVVSYSAGRVNPVLQHMLKSMMAPAIRMTADLLGIDTNQVQDEGEKFLQEIGAIPVEAMEQEDKE